ncbi:MAG: hypothetical protein SFU91_07615 [Chloroherpetonaceae bacterium]|nr:hypothetical protein [Chloroherpetonaceae bacterium]
MNQDQPKQTHKLLTLFKHFFSIIIPTLLGVFIGLAGSNYQKQKELMTYQEKILVAILEEHRNNSIEIKHQLTLHNLLIDSLSKYNSATNVKVIDIIQTLKGFKTPTIRSIFWKSLVSVNLLTIELARFELLSKIQSETDNYYYLEKKIADKLYNSLYSSSKEDKAVLAIMISDLVFFENSLLSYYQQYETLYLKYD